MVQTLYRGNQETFAVDIQNLSNILTFLPFSTAPIVDLTGSAGGNGHGSSSPGVVPMAMPPRKNYMSPTLHGYPFLSSASEEYVRTTPSSYAAPDSPMDKQDYDNLAAIGMQQESLQA